jgi:dsDNA-binding SOS-regulon protein
MIMAKKTKHTTDKKKKKVIRKEQESIEELKIKIQRQKDALNKIIKNIQHETKSKDKNDK